MLFVNDNVQKSEGYYIVKIYKETLQKMKEKIRNKFNADCIEMEGSAIAQVCKLDKIPFLVVRSISDKPNGQNEITFDKFLEKASRRCAYIINEFFTHQ